MCVFGTGRREMRVTWRGGLGRHTKSFKLDKFLESTAHCSSVHFRLEIIFEFVICDPLLSQRLQSVFLFREAERHILKHLWLHT